MSEADEMRRIMLEVSKAGARIFRNNCAQAVVGQVEWVRRPQRVAVGPGDAVVRHARVLHAGLTPGSSDLIGWRSRVVTPDMVGSQVALFLAIEAKAADGRVTPEQQNFIAQVRAAGGIAGLAYSAADALALIG